MFEQFRNGYYYHMPWGSDLGRFGEIWIWVEFILSLCGDSWFKSNDKMDLSPSALHHQRCASSYWQRSRRARTGKNKHTLQVWWSVSVTQSSWPLWMQSSTKLAYQPRNNKSRQESYVHTTDVNMCVRHMCIIIWNWTLLLINYDESLTL
jgi:hypothetical protein